MQRRRRMLRRASKDGKMKEEKRKGRREN